MLNPNEIAARRFDKQMSGYKIDEVESYLSQVAQEYAAVCNERYDLERKMEVLADKLEEYRRDEESLKSAVFEAQKLGSNLVRDAKVKAERIIQEATEKAHFLTTDAATKADAQITEANRRCEEIKRESETAQAQQQEYYDRLKSEVSQFKRHMTSIYKQHIELIAQLPDQIAQESAKRETAEQERQPEPEPDAQPAEVAYDEPSYTQGDTQVYEPSYEPEQPAEADALPDMPIERGKPEQVPMTAPEAPPVAGFEPEAATREMPAVQTRRGPLKFGEGYDIHSEREERGKRRK